ncbi:MAG: Hsp20/alpha crystallin family protein [Vicinamibacterales bacterium]
MAANKDTALTRNRPVRDPFSTLRQMASELERAFEQPFGSAFHWPSFRGLTSGSGENWVPQIDLLERDGRLVTKVDLPGLKKEDVKVEVSDGLLVISGERKSETERKQDNVYRCERSYGSFSRAVPLPEGAGLDDVTATFADGVLEVSVPMPAKVQATARTITIGEPPPAGKGAAA